MESGFWFFSRVHRHPLCPWQGSWMCFVKQGPPVALLLTLSSGNQQYLVSLGAT